MKKWETNDVVCFIGDSITAAEKYNRILIDYYVQNFPEKHILFRNAAIPGAGTTLAIDNFEKLIGSHHPTAATVMFGMNDLQLVLYADSARITENLLKKREAALVHFAENTKKLHALLTNIPHVYMTPTVHEESTLFDTPIYRGYNETLRKAAAFLRENISPVLDLHTYLEDLNRRQLIPSIIGADRVHPGNIGHVLIADKILRAQGFENPKLPLWDKTITADEKAVLSRFGIIEDTRPENPYSEARSKAARRLILFYYVEMNVLAGQGIDIADTEKANAFLNEQLKLPLEDWRILAYTDYMKNRDKIPVLEQDVMDKMEKMYSV